MYALLRAATILTVVLGYSLSVAQSALAECQQGPIETVIVKECKTKDAEWQKNASWYEKAEWVTLTLQDGNHADYRAYNIVYYEDGWESERAKAYLATLNPCDGLSLNHPIALRKQKTCCDTVPGLEECLKTARTWLELVEIKSLHPSKL